MSHKMLAPVAIGAAKIAGLGPKQIYTLADGPGDFHVQSIE